MITSRERSRNLNSRRALNTRFKPYTAKEPTSREGQNFFTVKLKSGKSVRFWVPPGFTIGEPYKEGPPPEPEEENECPVCYADCTEDDRLKCGHFICKDCLGMIVKPECPVCREPIEALAGKPEKPAANPYPGEADWQTRQVLISQFLNYDLNPNDIYDTYQVFHDINPLEEVPDVDHKFISRLRKNRIVPNIKTYITEQKARGRKPDLTKITTYTQEYYRLRKEEEVYDKWVTYVPGGFNELVKKATFQGLRNVDEMTEIMIDILPPIPDHQFLTRVSHGQANFAQGIAQLERLEL